MLPTSQTAASDQYSRAKPKSSELQIERKSLFSWIQAHFSFNHRRTWFFLSLLLLQILILFYAPTFTLSNSTPPPQSLPSITVHSGGNTITAARTTKVAGSQSTECPNGRVYIYELPPFFNSDLLKNCDKLDPWNSRCDALSNSGFGKIAAGISRIMPENLAKSWFWTDQFSLEVTYHNRMSNHRCRTSDPESATAFYIPFYSGLAVAKYLFFKNSTAAERDHHCNSLLNWVSEQPYFKKSSGWDHFITMGRISWDFRRSKDGDWGSSCIYMPKMRNITRLLIERNPWDYFDVGVPYPTGFHPSTVDDVRMWQDFVRSRQRKTQFCFVGATRGFIKQDFRGILLSQCYRESGSCRVTDCAGTKCLNGSSRILETFLDSDFCLQPRGDSFTRRSTFDCMVAGSIPVFFWKRTAYYQYEFFLPGQPESYSVYIDRNEVKNGTTVKSVLDKISPGKIKRMREKVIEYIPRIIYAKPHQGLEGIKDAFDLAVEGVLRRIKQHDGWYKWK